MARPKKPAGDAAQQDADTEATAPEVAEEAAARQIGAADAAAPEGVAPETAAADVAAPEAAAIETAAAETPGEAPAASEPALKPRLRIRRSPAAAFPLVGDSPRPVVAVPPAPATRPTPPPPSAPPDLTAPPKPAAGPPPTSAATEPAARPTPAPAPARAPRRTAAAAASAAPDPATTIDAASPPALDADATQALDAAPPPAIRVRPRTSVKARPMAPATEVPSAAPDAPPVVASEPPAASPARAARRRGDRRVAAPQPPAESEPVPPQTPDARELPDQRDAASDPVAAAAVVTPPAPWDAIVVGGGHNAVVAAAYMARAGIRTLVLERRDRIGGAASTSEVAPGFRVPTLAHTVGRMRSSVVRDLELTSHGLTLVAPDVRVFAPQPGKRAVTLWADSARTVEGLRRWSARDADRYVSFDRLVRSLGGFLADIANITPPDIHAPGIGDALAGLKLGRQFRGLGRHDSRTILRVLPMAVADFVAEAFETDALRAAIAWRGVQYCSLGPWSAGTTAVLLADSAGNDGGAPGQTVFARGGPGELAWALEAAALAAGVEVRTGTDVTAITSRDGRVTGVALASGEEIRAPVVVSGLDPKRTLVGLIDPVALGPSLGWRAGNIRTPGVVAKVNLALRRLPNFPSADDDAQLAGRIVVAPGIDAMERAFDATKYGRLSERPILEATIPSLADPSLVAGAKAGSQVMSVLLQYAPYRLRDAHWDDAGREALGDLAVRTLETVAPGLGKLVVAREVLTPVDLERDYGLSGGHPLHAEPGLDQFFLWRPLLGHARYRMPLDGLYLAGSGAHPGGGLTGGPGQNAAREIIADWKKRKKH